MYRLLRRIPILKSCVGTRTCIGSLERRSPARGAAASATTAPNGCNVISPFTIVSHLIVPEIIDSSDGTPRRKVNRTRQCN